MPDTETAEALIAAVQSHAWYAMVGLAITVLIAIWRLVRPTLWARIPRQWQWLPAVALAGASGFVGAWEDGSDWRVALAVALYTALVGGTAAIGAAHTGKRMLEDKQ